MNKIKDIFVSFWPTMLVLGVILYATLSSDPVGSDMPPIPHIDKLIHAIMMGGLVGAIAFDWQRRCCRLAPRRARACLSHPVMLAIVGIVLLFSIGDELLQGAMENGRANEPLDLVADAVGALVAFFTAPPAIRKVLKVK